ncbi:hypothetical protein [Lacinutrix venerupis]|uniref:Uncharacterized protein n=1 Tax=Lacinutrix venerupis TaxID=1486034 RepID=A0AAC9LN67_9FLAO|nr:hypothetical protein [Lacinutrix venerupis]APY00500.1 hypothetical protein BWR22_09275 [Lacinutrix venerupis]
MKAAVITKSTEYYISIKECLINTQGISNLIEDASNNKIIFEFTTHNAVEGLREKLIIFGTAIEFVFL